jgi:hypothetical protein
VDANGQTLAYVYGHADPRDAQVAKEARRIASNIAKLPSLSGDFRADAPFHFFLSSLALNCAERKRRPQ